MATYTNKQIVAAYVQNDCSKTKTAEKLKINLVTLFQYIRDREGLKAMIKEADDLRVDMNLDNAETILQRLVEFHDFRAVKFFLETKGRKRGYGQKIEISKEEGDRKFSSVKIVNGDKVIELK